MLASLAALALVPLSGSLFLQYFMFLLFIYLTLSVSWNIIAGYAGQLCLAHAAFFGSGAYTFALLTLSGINAYLAILTGGVAAILCSLSVLPCFRLRGTYFAVGTLLLPEIMKVIIINIRELGGAGGLSLPVPKEFTMATHYYLSLFLAVVTVVATYFMVKSKLGYTLFAIGDDEDAAESVGIPTLRYKIVALFLSAFFAGLAGSIYTHYILYIQPYHVFGIEWTIYPAFMVLLGGIRRLDGSIVGAIVFTIMFYILTLYVTELSLIIFGFLLAVITVVMPEGLMPRLYKVFSKEREVA